MRIFCKASPGKSKSKEDMTLIIGFTLGFVFVVGLLIWLLQPKKPKIITSIKLKEPVQVEKPPPRESDDLTRIEGIGPKINSVLQQAGITTYTLLASSDTSQLRDLLAEAQLARFNPETWPEQAALAAKGDWEALSDLQDELQGGRRA